MTVEVNVEVDAKNGVEYTDIRLVDGSTSVGWHPESNELAVGVGGVGKYGEPGRGSSRITPDQADALASALTAAATKARKAEVHA